MTEYALKLLEKSEVRAKAMQSKLGVKSNGKTVTEKDEKHPISPERTPDSALWSSMACRKITTVFEVEDLLKDYDFFKSDPLRGRLYRFMSTDLIYLRKVLTSEYILARREIAATETYVTMHNSGSAAKSGSEYSVTSYWMNILHRCEECSLRLSNLVSSREYYLAGGRDSVSEVIQPPQSVPEKKPEPRRDPAPLADEEIISFNRNVVTLEIIK